MAVCPVADVTALVGQPVHVEAAVAPKAAEYVFRLQSVHDAAPVTALYFPATQVVQVPPLGPVYPRLQRQSEIAVIPVVEVTVLVGQPVHVEAAVAPTAAEYVPKPQCVHAEAPASVEYVPAPQLVHTPLPMVVLYFPASHKAHDVWFGPVEPAGQGGTAQAPRAVLPAGELVPSGHAAQDCIWVVWHVYTLLIQTEFVFKEVVQPDRHPPITPPKFQDNRCSQFVDSMSDKFKLILLDGANPTELLVKYQKALLLGYATVVEEDVTKRVALIDATSENDVANVSVFEPITVHPLLTIFELRVV